MMFVKIPAQVFLPRVVHWPPVVAFVSSGTNMKASEAAESLKMTGHCGGVWYYSSNEIKSKVVICRCFQVYAQIHTSAFFHDVRYQCRRECCHARTPQSWTNHNPSENHLRVLAMLVLRPSRDLEEGCSTSIQDATNLDMTPAFEAKSCARCLQTAATQGS